MADMTLEPQESRERLAALLADQQEDLQRRDTEHRQYLAGAPRTAWDGWWGLWHYVDGAYHSVRFRQAGRRLTARWQGAERVYRMEGVLSESGLLCVAATCHAEVVGEDGEPGNGEFVGPVTMEMGRAGTTVQMSWDWARLYPRGTHPRTIARALPELFMLCGPGDEVWSQIKGQLADAGAYVETAAGGKGYSMDGGDAVLTAADVVSESSRGGRIAVWNASPAALKDVFWRAVPLHAVAICAARDVRVGELHVRLTRLNTLEFSCDGEDGVHELTSASLLPPVPADPSEKRGAPPPDAVRRLLLRDDVADHGATVDAPEKNAECAAALAVLTALCVRAGVDPPEPDHAPGDGDPAATARFHFSERCLQQDDDDRAAQILSVLRAANGGVVRRAGTVDVEAEARPPSPP